MKLKRRELLAVAAGFSASRQAAAAQLGFPAATHEHRPAIQPDLIYTMPAHFGGRKAVPAYYYGDVLTLFVSYATDADAVAAFLPEPFETPDPPVVTVYYQRYRKVDFLAGRGYNVLGVNLAAAFRGRRDKVAGDYAAMLWENNTIPILGGREFLGAPKVYAEIPDPLEEAGGWSFHCSLYGHRMVEGRLTDLKALDGGQLRKAAEATRPWMCWKLIPNASGGADLSYPTAVTSKCEYTRGWSAAGSHRFCETTWEAVLEHHKPLECLRTLACKAPVAAGALEGSMELRVHACRKLE
jgi:acetoacetate decarboxylase